MASEGQTGKSQPGKRNKPANAPTVHPGGSLPFGRRAGVLDTTARHAGKEGENKMKYATTRKNVTNSFENRISIPYCGLQRLLSCESAVAYTVRREGWGADIYDFGSTCIVTGYAPFGNISPDYKMREKYEQKAEQIIEYYNFSYDKRKRRLRELICEFLEEAIQSKGGETK